MNFNLFLYLKLYEEKIPFLNKKVSCLIDFHKEMPYIKTGESNI